MTEKMFPPDEEKLFSEDMKKLMSELMKKSNKITFTENMLALATTMFKTFLDLVDLTGDSRVALTLCIKAMPRVKEVSDYPLTDDDIAALYAYIQIVHDILQSWCATISTDEVRDNE